MTTSTMDRSAIQEELTSVFREVFDNETLVVDESTTAADIAGWDSQLHMVLVLAVEQHFGIWLSSSELDALRNVGDLTRLVLSKLDSS